MDCDQSAMGLLPVTPAVFFIDKSFWYNVCVTEEYLGFLFYSFGDHHISRETFTARHRPPPKFSTMIGPALPSYIGSPRPSLDCRSTLRHLLVRGRHSRTSGMYMYFLWDQLWNQRIESAVTYMDLVGIKLFNHKKSIDKLRKKSKTFYNNT
jgi:hypothetical protein